MRTISALNVVHTSPARPRWTRRLGVVAAAWGCAGVLAAPVDAAGPESVYFVSADHLRIVERPAGSGADRAGAVVRRLLAGPTGAERRDGVTTAIPRSVTLTGVELQGGVAVLRLAGPFDAGTGRSRRMRRAQVTFTLTALPAITGVCIVASDSAPVPTPMGTVTSPPLDATPCTPLTRASFTGLRATGPIPLTVRDVQRRLAALRYLAAGTATGRLDERTRQALFAFQGWEGLVRDGALPVSTRSRLATAKTPRPMTGGGGRRIDVDRARGVLLLVDGDAVRRAIHVSPGRHGRTPAGSFRVYRKERMSWSRPFRVWMPWASYFHGGYAIHEYPDVPAYPASHGCVRVGHAEARVVYEFTALGMPVTIR